MKNTAPSSSDKGFTLIEGLVSATILAVLAGLSTPYFFGSREKNLLETQKERVLHEIKNSQQKAMNAQKGFDHSLIFNPETEQITLYPDIQTIRLDSKIDLVSISPTDTITFARLTGKPDTSLEVVLASKKFSAKITVSQEGIIEATPPEKK
ncbi:MAG: type II secretion system protein [Candidatus Pacebacteria bacterium]|nr:type II secretion system protein [Candidatus Paceibacterota bacterium]